MFFSEVLLSFANDRFKTWCAYSKGEETRQLDIIHRLGKETSLLGLIGST